MEPLPRLGPRTILRRLALTDLERFQGYRTAAVGRYQGWSVVSDAEAAGFLTEMRDAPFCIPGVWIQIGIAERSTGRLIGDIGICVLQAETLHAEIGFTLSDAFQGQGLATEAVREAISLLFAYTDIAHVVGITDTRNIPSMRLLERLGMRLTETVETVFRGEPCSEHFYRLDRPAEPTT